MINTTKTKGLSATAINTYYVFQRYSMESNGKDVKLRIMIVPIKCLGGMVKYNQVAIEIIILQMTRLYIIQCLGFIP